jgi:hypothetical protein
VRAHLHTFQSVSKKCFVQNRSPLQFQLNNGAKRSRRANKVTDSKERLSERWSGFVMTRHERNAYVCVYRKKRGRNACYTKVGQATVMRTRKMSNDKLNGPQITPGNRR